MDKDYILELFNDLWKREARCFSHKLELYDKETFEDDFVTYSYEIARKTKAKILEFHYEALKNLYDCKDCDLDTFNSLENALSLALRNIDIDLKFFIRDYVN